MTQDPQRNALPCRGVAAVDGSLSSSARTAQEIDTVHPPKIRLITAKLTVNYNRGLYLPEDTVENRRLRRTSSLVSEAADGTITIRANGRVLPYPRHPRDLAGG